MLHFALIISLSPWPRFEITTTVSWKRLTYYPITFNSLCRRTQHNLMICILTITTSQSYLSILTFVDSMFWHFVCKGRHLEDILGEESYFPSKNKPLGSSTGW